jgi:hypothetical protein
VLDENGHFGEASQNLIEGVHLLDFEADLRRSTAIAFEDSSRQKRAPT